MIETYRINTAEYKKSTSVCLDILRGQRLLANLKKIKKGNFCMIQNSLVELTATAHE